jgi:hypothetical protein
MATSPPTRMEENTSAVPPIKPMIVARSIPAAYKFHPIEFIKTRRFLPVSVFTESMAAHSITKIVFVMAMNLQTTNQGLPKIPSTSVAEARGLNVENQDDIARCFVITLRTILSNS